MLGPARPCSGPPCFVRITVRRPHHPASAASSCVGRIILHRPHHPASAASPGLGRITRRRPHRHRLVGITQLRPHHPASSASRCVVRISCLVRMTIRRPPILRRPHPILRPRHHASAARPEAAAEFDAQRSTENPSSMSNRDFGMPSFRTLPCERCASNWEGPARTPRPCRRHTQAAHAHAHTHAGVARPRVRSAEPTAVPGGTRPQPA